MKNVLPAIAVSLLALTGCETTNKVASVTEPTYEQASNNSLTAANYKAADELIKRYRGASQLATNNYQNSGTAPFIVATLVNIDRLEQSSTLGRLISEQVASRLTQQGFDVVELKVRNNVFMKRNEGELLLTREIKEMATAHKTEAVIVGTYAEGGDMVYVTLKIVNPATSRVLAAQDYTLPQDRQVRRLLMNIAK